MQYSRQQALTKIRAFLLQKRRGDETTCQTAARCGIFCRGYDQWSTEQLRQQYPWLAAKLPAETPREELLKLIIAWDGARALVREVDTTCEAKMIDHDGCLGFDRFNNDQLRNMFPQLFKPEDLITQW
jgi:hypothetical protein